MEIAAELGRRGMSGSALPSLFAHTVEAIAAHLHVEFSSFLELLPDGSAFFQAGVGWKDGIVGHTTIELSGESAAGQVIRTLTPLAISDLRCDSAGGLRGDSTGGLRGDSTGGLRGDSTGGLRGDGRLVVSPLLREHAVVSTLMVPLFDQSRPLGVLGAHSSQPRTYSAEEVSWLQVLANILSARLEREQYRQGERDPQLLRAEQMMAIGQVAAGVAHELRNPLTSIKGLVQVNLRELGTRGLPVDDLAVIEHEIRRMEKTLQTFLDFARPPEPDRRLQEIAPIVERVLALVGGRARKQHVALRFVPPESNPEAEVDGDQIQQLLLNLVLNALDALPQGGNIEVDLNPPRDGFLEIYVRDSGPGIASHILPKVFETFVSSKETGVGLGLPLSRRIAEDHGGTLTAYNLPLEGACFLLRLPATAS
jgi:signal transduction histidine kinase